MLAFVCFVPFCGRSLVCGIGGRHPKASNLGFPFPSGSQKLPPVRFSVVHHRHIWTRLHAAGWVALAVPSLVALGICLAAAAPIAVVEGSAEAPLWRIRDPLDARSADAVGEFAAALFYGASPAAPDGTVPVFRQPALVYAAARADGERLAFAWRQETNAVRALRGAMDDLRRHLTAAEHTRVDTIEVNLGHSFLRADPNGDDSRLSNIYRGLLGVQLSSGGRVHQIAPTEMIAQNLSFERAIERLAQRAQISPSSVGGPSARLSVFEADALLVSLGKDRPRTTRLYRGNTLVPITEVTRTSVEQLADALTGWLMTNLQADGRLPYLYWPSRGEESTSNNTLRQWLASIALNRAVQSRGDPALQERVRQNLRYNLDHTYTRDDAGRGLVADADGAVKLGALAIACLALVENPGRSEFAREADSLRRTIDAMWQPNGEFRTFWRPLHRIDNVNFYPGEALLLWAHLYPESPDPTRWDRMLKSVRFYREWHRADRNPAFVPWHTQACFRMWQCTNTTELRDWIFEMNDWLLGVQQWDGQRGFPDTMGRFYDPDRPFGPPHASSTAVYLEGLIDAWQLARATGDTARQERYRRSLVRGLRSLLQLAFLDEVDLFYIQQKDRVRGGVRTTVYDNSIRIDNVQHSLMAALKILEHLPAEDFRP